MIKYSRLFLVILIALFLLSASLFNQTARGGAAQSEAVDLSSGAGEIGEGSVSEREAWLYYQRAYPRRTVPVGARLRAIKYLREQMLPTQKLIEQITGETITARWTEIGPSIVPNGQTFGSPPMPVSGRLSTIALHPFDQNIIYIGAAQGGVWKTTNGGQSWTALTDNLPSLAMGSLAIDPRNPEIIYAATGEAHFSVDSYYGAGIFKSTDGGATWINIGGPSFPTSSRPRISKIFIDPNNSNILYAGVASNTVTNSANGFYRSTDGGNAWSKLLSGRAVDFVFDPNDIGTIYIALSGFDNSTPNGIFKSTDAGANWTQLGGGLPTTDIARIAIAIAPSSPQTLYAVYENPSTWDLKGLFKSTDSGNSWEQLTDPPRGPFGNICQCFYDLHLMVDPLDAGIVYFGGVSLYKSTNGGASWRDISSGNGTGGIHADQHVLIFHPADRNRIWIGNDGGIWRSDDSGTSWIDLNTNLATIQFQTVAMHPTNASITYGGTQDNGTLKYLGTPSWTRVRGGDGGCMLVDFNNPSIVYHCFTRVDIERSDNGGITWARKLNGFPRDRNGNISDRAAFYAPVVMDPVDPQTLYFGTFRLWKTTNKAESWSPISPDLTEPGDGAVITAIAVAPGSTSTIYVGTSNSRLQATTNGGETWANVTRSPLPNRFVTSIAVDPNLSQTAYVTFSGFNANTPSTPGHVFKTTDGGTTWRNVSSNLPDIPVNKIIANPVLPNTFYIGTDIGVFQTTNGGASWISINEGLPTVAVFDLDIKSNLGIMRAATHGRGMFEIRLDQLVNSPVLSIDQSSLNFNAIVGEGDPPPKILTISNTGGGTFNFSTTVSTGKEIFSVSPSAGAITAGSSVQLSISARNPGSSGTINGELFITAAGAINSPQTVQLALTTITVTRIKLDRVSLDFGNVEVGKTSELSFTVSNSGSATLIVSSIVRTGNRFNVVSPVGGFSVAPGGRQTVTARFSPIAAGQQSATLTISSNDPDNPEQTVALTGNGIVIRQGDLNNDDQVNVQDLILLIQILSGVVPSISAADVDRDGSVNVQDLIRLLQILGKP